VPYAEANAGSISAATQLHAAKKLKRLGSCVRLGRDLNSELTAQETHRTVIVTVRSP